MLLTGDANLATWLRWILSCFSNCEVTVIGQCLGELVGAHQRSGFAPVAVCGLQQSSLCRLPGGTRPLPAVTYELEPSVWTRCALAPLRLCGLRVLCRCGCADIWFVVWVVGQPYPCSFGCSVLPLWPSGTLGLAPVSACRALLFPAPRIIQAYPAFSCLVPGSVPGSVPSPGSLRSSPCSMMIGSQDLGTGVLAGAEELAPLSGQGGVCAPTLPQASTSPRSLCVSMTVTCVHVQDRVCSDTSS